MTNTVTLKPNSAAQALVVLHTRSHQQGAGVLHPDIVLTEDVVQRVLDYQDGYVDYLHGRVIKVDFNTEELDLRLFDRDVGEDAGYNALSDAGLLA